MFGNTMICSNENASRELTNLHIGEDYEIISMYLLELENRPPGLYGFR